MLVWIKNWKLRTKLLATGIFLTAIPLMIVSVVVYLQNQKMLQSSVKQATRLAHGDLDHVAEGVRGLVESHQEVNEKTVKSFLNMAREIAAMRGGFGFSDEQVEWTGSNQFDSTSVSIRLPKMKLGDTWLGQVSDPKSVVPLVDQVRSISEVTCTVFQRMNDAGDMLRVATNVIQKDGSRAIGTYIPKVMPDGKLNAVVSEVLKGETYIGRAFVVSGWYLTTYEPIRDPAKNIVGMLYVGVPQESIKSLRQAIMDLKVGESGYVYVLDGTGRYIISQGGKRDGEDISNVKDSNGSLFIQEICSKALTLKDREIGEHTYSWKNAGDPAPRDKVVKIAYFKPWDWVIGVGLYTDDFLKTTGEVRDLGSLSNRLILWIMGIALVGSILTWILASRGITRPVNLAIDRLKEGSQRVVAVANEISDTSRSLAEGASEQAASIEETSSALEEMSSMTRQNADNSGQAAQLMKEVHQIVSRADGSMHRLAESIGEIAKAGEETQKIVKTIDEIAFQTNLLALNAAVEAARAGEAGAGFAVVADEVRNLAMRAADAAKNTASLIDGTVKTVRIGSELTQTTSQEFTQVSSSVAKMNELVSEIAVASQEQAQGIEQVNRAVTEMDKVTQQNAAIAEETAAASEVMRIAAGSMEAPVGQLIVMVRGHSSPSSVNGRKAKANSAGKENRSTEHGPRGGGVPSNGRGKAVQPVSKPSNRKPMPVLPIETEAIKVGEYQDF
jgi:methyl-accepting chemotaxis protein